MQIPLRINNVLSKVSDAMGINGHVDLLELLIVSSLNPQKIKNGDDENVK